MDLDVDNLLNLPAYQEMIAFISNPSLAFASREISAVTFKNDRIQIKLPFLSSHSPLPNYYLEEMDWEGVEQDHRLTALLDMFNHQLATYLYKIWRKYRYDICYQENGER